MAPVFFKNNGRVKCGQTQYNMKKQMKSTKKPAKLFETINNTVTFETDEIINCEIIVKRREITYEYLLICYNIDDPNQDHYL